MYHRQHDVNGHTTDMTMESDQQMPSPDEHRAVRTATGEPALQVAIARTREQLCAAVRRTSPGLLGLSVSARIDDTDLFLITPDDEDLTGLGPERTVLCTFDGRVVEHAFDGGSGPSRATADHAAVHKRDQPGAVASRAGRTATASDPASALDALAAMSLLPPDGTSSPHHSSSHQRRRTQ